MCSNINDRYPRSQRAPASWLRGGTIDAPPGFEAQCYTVHAFDHRAALFNAMGNVQVTAKTTIPAKRRLDSCDFCGSSAAAQGGQAHQDGEEKISNHAPVTPCEHITPVLALAVHDADVPDSVDGIPIPKTHKQAMNSEYKHHWLTANKQLLEAGKTRAWHEGDTL